MRSLRVTMVSLAGVLVLSLPACSPSNSGPSGPPGPTETTYPSSLWVSPDIPVGSGTFLPYGIWYPPNSNSTPSAPSDALTNPAYKGQYYIATEVAIYMSDLSSIGGGKAPSGQRLVGAMIVVQNFAPPAKSTDVDIAGNVEVIADNGSTFHALQGAKLDSSHPMLPWGSQTLKGGNSVIGWLVFSIPSNDAIAKIHVAPKGIYAGQASWLVCDVAHTAGCRQHTNQSPTP